jgi:uncharacterized protein DUF6484
MKTNSKRAVRSRASSTKATSRAAGAAPREVGSLPSTVVAKLAALDGDGGPWVILGEGRARARRARTIVALGTSAVGREVLVCFSGSVRTPVVIGVVRAAGDPVASEPALDLLVNRRRLVLSADEEVVIRCGQARITLTAGGKIVVEGADLVSSAKRINRIRGGAVRIN